MLPELSLSWRLIKPVRALLVFLVILLASFIALGQLYWQVVQAYQKSVPTGAASANYLTVGSEQLSQSGMLNQCMVGTLSNRANADDYATFYQLYENDWIVKSASNRVSVPSERIQTIPDNFIEFFGVTPIEQFFDHNTMYRERWVYVRESWWLANQHLAVSHNQELALTVSQKVETSTEIVRSSETLPIAGVLPDDFWPYQDRDKTDLFVSNGLAYWAPFIAFSGEWQFDRPYHSAFVDNTWAKTILKMPSNVSAAQLQAQLNEIPAPCIDTATYFKVLPGTRTDAPSYQSQRESASLLSLIMLVLTIITLLYSIAVAQRLQSVRQQEFLLKVAIGGSPARLAKQIWLETLMLCIVSVALSVLIYSPLNSHAQTLGFAQSETFSLLPWLLLSAGVFLIGGYLVLASRKVVDPEYVYQGLTNMRHKISHKFWWLQLNHALYLVVLAIAVLVMGLLSSAYWRQLTPNDALAQSQYKILVDEWQDEAGRSTFVSSFDSSRDVFQILRENRDDMAKLCFDQLAISVQVVDSNLRPEVVVQSIASYSFFDHVLNLGERDLSKRGSRDSYLTQSAANKLGLETDMRDVGDTRLATVPRLDANESLRFTGKASIQQVLPTMNLPNQADAPILFQPQLVPACNGVIWVAPDFDVGQLNDLEYTVAMNGKRIGFKLMDWQDYMILAQPIAGERLRLVIVLSAIALAALLVIVLLNTQFLFQRMQPWYWLNIAQGMPPRVAKMQTQLRIGVLSTVALAIALALALVGFYQFFPLVAQWLPQRNALNMAIVATVSILLVQQVSLWWCARSLNNKDLSVWRV